MEERQLYHEFIELDAKRKKGFHVFSASLLCLVFIVLSFINYFDGLYPDLAVDLIIIGLCIGSLVAMKYMDRTMAIIRATYFVVCLTFFYGIYLGIGHETILYYVFAMPPLLYFYFGKREGGLWLGLFVATVTFIILTPAWTNGYRYQPLHVPRFFITLAIVIITSYGIESARYTYSKLAHEKSQLLLQEKQRLEKALKEIKTLSGMIPICSNCKKIRNDEGFWEQVESYIKHRSEASFSHGICPDCAKVLYPEIEELKRKG